MSKFPTVSSLKQVKFSVWVSPALQLPVIHEDVCGCQTVSSNVALPTQTRVNFPQLDVSFFLIIRVDTTKLEAMLNSELRLSVQTWNEIH